MAPDLETIAAALAAVTDHELRGLMTVTIATPQIAPGLLAWIAAACDWELNRRAGVDYELLPP